MAISSFNKGNVFNFNTEGLQFAELEDLYNSDENKVYPIKGFFINSKSKFGPRPVVVTPDFMADLPQHMLETVNQIIADPETVQQINDGKAGFRIRSYISKTYNKECFTVSFVDL